MRARPGSARTMSPTVVWMLSEFMVVNLILAPHRQSERSASDEGNNVSLVKLDVNVQLSIMQLISRTSEYALRAILWLVQEPSASQTTRQIAVATHAPPDYISKVLQLLTKAGLVRSQRGLGGGFLFAGDPAEITVLDVINAVGPLERIHTCPLGLKAHGKNLCPLHCGMNDVVTQMETTFAHTKLSALLSSSSASVPLGINLKSVRRKSDPARIRRGSKISP